MLPKGKHESEASFALRLETAVGCSVPCLPQGHDETDAQVRVPERARSRARGPSRRARPAAQVELRLRAQRAAPHVMVWPHHPQLESLEAFERRCHDLLAAPKKKEGRRHSALRRLSRALSTRSAGSSGKSERLGDGDEQRSSGNKGRSSLMGRLSRVSGGGSKEKTPPAPDGPSTSWSASADQSESGKEAGGDARNTRGAELKKALASTEESSKTARRKKKGFIGRLFSRKKS